MNIHQKHMRVEEIEVHVQNTLPIPSLVSQYSWGWGGVGDLYDQA